MKLNIDGSDYKIKFNILSRIKLSQKFSTEDEMFEFIKNGDFDTLVIFIRNCIQDNIDDSFFLSAFPKVQETKEAFLKLATKLIKEATDPFGLREPIKDTSDNEEPVKIDFKALIIEIMSKGYTQKEALDMTNWDIVTTFEADSKKLEREAFHTNTIVNAMVGLMGGKGDFDMLGRKKVEDIENKYKLECEALNFLNSIRGGDNGRGLES